MRRWGWLPIEATPSLTPEQKVASFITKLINASIDSKIDQYLADHKNSKIIMIIYASVKNNKPEQLEGITYGNLTTVQTVVHRSHSKEIHHDSAVGEEILLPLKSMLEVKSLTV